MPQPSIGRVLWFYPPLVEDQVREQPWPCLVTYVHSDDLVNVAGFASDGSHFAANEVTLRNPPADGEAIPNDRHVSWMPYQVSQETAKTVPQVTKL